MPAQTLSEAKDPDLPLESRCRLVADALVVPPDGPERPQTCGAFEASGRFVTESLCYSESALRPATIQPDHRIAVGRVSGTWLYGGVLSGHFGHMLCEATARLWALDLPVDVSGILYFARPHGRERQVARRFKPFADMLGLPTVRVLEHAVSVERLLVPEQGFGAGELLCGRPEVRAFLRGRFGNVPTDGVGRHIYITRSGQPVRRGVVLDELGIESLFRSAGYEVIAPETLPLEKQVAIFRGASAVVSTEGSALHLLSFVAAEDCRIAIIRRRPSALFEQIRDSLAWFTGRSPIALSESVSAHGCPSSRNPNLLFLEPSRAAMRRALVDSGMLPSATRDWPELTADERAKAVRRIEVEIERTLVPIALADSDALAEVQALD
jgi:hypothetical protein